MIETRDLRVRSESVRWLRSSGEVLAVALLAVALLSVALLAACGPGLTPLPGPADPAPDPMELPIPANPATADA